MVVFDAGEEDGLYYITMELVEGKSVQALLDAGHAFPLPRVLRIMEQTCSALQFAHERNVVHRDIKPANIMLTGDDTVKVTDFGTAKILQFGTVQQTAHVMGTPSYMSPEQVKGRAVDGRSDIFSLGVMLYEMITGEKPFPGPKHHHRDLQDRERRAGAAAADQSFHSPGNQRGGDAGAGERAGNTGTRAAGKCWRICATTGHGRGHRGQSADQRW